jgi:23S rRNA (uracil1939-C5)-methyltransferase
VDGGLCFGIDEGRIFVSSACAASPTTKGRSRAISARTALPYRRARYRRLAVESGHSDLRVIPRARPRIRSARHLAAIGHPVLGDDRYGHPRRTASSKKHALDRTFLPLRAPRSITHEGARA